MKGQTVMRDGKPVEQWAFGVAFPKADFQAQIWPALAAEAATGYPQGTPPRFAWKYQDGDGIDSKGVPFNQREGYAGCFVLTVSSELMAPPIYKLVGGGYVQLQPNEIKCGDYVVVGLMLKVNVATGTNTPSVYINPLAVELVGIGSEIVSVGAADPMALFGGAARQLPPGVSMVPQATAGAPGMPGMSAPPAPMMQPPAAMAPPPPPPPPVAGPSRPLDPTHIALNPAGGEMWWTGTAWIAAPMLPPPAPDFVHNAGMHPPPMTMPGMMPPR